MAYDSKEVHLKRRPEGWPTHDDFALVERRLPEPAPGELIVRNQFISVDPYMRGRMNDVASYVPPFRLGEVMDGGAVGVVEASGSEDFARGITVVHNSGWRDVALVNARHVREVNPTIPPAPSVHLGALGMTGLTAYAGLLEVAKMRPGDAVFVSGAAGAVGQMVGQIARLKGAKSVVGSVGSDTKVEFVTKRLGFDAAFNYRNGSAHELLGAAAPEGIDVYFDNVGGEHLEAAIGMMRTHARAAICGAIAQYNATEPPAAPRNLAMLIGKRLTLRGFLVADHNDRMEDFVADVGTWLTEGRIVVEETVVPGIDNAVEAFLGMLRGENIGKMVVKI